jgi:hypothetical protein
LFFPVQSQQMWRENSIPNTKKKERKKLMAFSSSCFLQLHNNKQVFFDRPRADQQPKQKKVWNKNFVFFNSFRFLF